MAYFQPFGPAFQQRDPGQGAFLTMSQVPPAERMSDAALIRAPQQFGGLGMVEAAQEVAQMIAAEKAMDQQETDQQEADQQEETGQQLRLPGLGPKPLLESAIYGPAALKAAGAAAAIQRERARSQAVHDILSLPAISFSSDNRRSGQLFSQGELRTFALIGVGLAVAVGGFMLLRSRG